MGLPWWLSSRESACSGGMQWETRNWSLGGEDPLEKEITTHASILAWRILWKEEPGGLQCMGHKERDMTERLSTHTIFWHLRIPSNYNLKNEDVWIFESFFFPPGLQKFLGIEKIGTFANIRGLKAVIKMSACSLKSFEIAFYFHVSFEILFPRMTGLERT